MSNQNTFCECHLNPHRALFTVNIPEKATPNGKIQAPDKVAYKIINAMVHLTSV